MHFTRCLVNFMWLFVCLWSLIFGLFTAARSHAEQRGIKPQQLVIYTSRAEYLLKPVLDKYSAKYSVQFRYMQDKAAALVQKLITEGKHTQADLLITVDAGNLWFATQNDLLTSLTSKTLATTVPVHLRADDMSWVGLSVRARPIVYNARRVNVKELHSYEELANEKWRGKLCLRTGKKVYNRSLVAMLLEMHGAKKTEAILKGWVQNLAAPVFSSDTKVIEAIKAGQCALGIVNTYYLGRLLKKDPAYPVRIFWPNQTSYGAHVNVSGAGIVRHSRNHRAALAVLEWLSQGEAQRMFAELNLEYPVNSKIAQHTIVHRWGKFKASNISLARIGSLQKEAIRVMDRAGYM